LNRYAGFVGHTLSNNVKFSEELQQKYVAYINIIKDNYQNVADEDALAEQGIDRQ